jgi:Acyl-CoA dehydrogenase, C-terminal domain
MTFVEGADDLYVTSARSALQSMPGDEALRVLGWADLLDGMDEDLDARLAVFAFFRAQGRELGSSRALGLLMARPYSRALELEPSTVATVERRSARRGRRAVVVGVPGSGRALIDRGEHGVFVVDIEAMELRPIGLTDGLVLHEVESDRADHPISLGEAEVAVCREQSLELGRMAIAYETLGAAEGALAMAVEHACARSQFGRPIAHFQAVRHLLASARVDLAAMESLARQSIVHYRHLPSMLDSILKALAGRNGRRVCESSLQVLGAMGFTAEHEHHRFHSRVLVLDALLGSSSSLTHQLAVTLRKSAGVAPALRVPIASL